MGYIASWSGGKDSCLACYKAIQQGLQVSYLMNFINAEYKRVSMHGVKAELIQKQAESIGLPLIQKEVTSGTGSNYENVFKETIKSAIRNSPSVIRGLICGDIYLQEHKTWLEAKCKELGIELIEPLWGMRTEEIMSEFIRSGFEAIVVSARPIATHPQTGMNKEWIGHRIDTDFRRYLKTRPYLDLCGEGGEYHTFVLNGPLFKKKIEIRKAAVIERDTSYGKWYFLDMSYA